MKIMHLMLDYDGVLHPSDVNRDPKTGRIYLGAGLEDDGSHTLFEHAELLVRLLDEIEASGETQVRIVLSTSWVRVISFSKAKRRLPESLQRRVIGATYHTAMENDFQSRDLYSSSYTNNSVFLSMTRCQQIARYCERHKLRESEWIAIDDDDHRWLPEYRDNLVHTDEVLGLGKIETQQELLQKFRGNA